MSLETFGIEFSGLLHPGMNVIKLFFFVTDVPFSKARVFVHILFSGLCNTREAGAYPSFVPALRVVYPHF